jgi:hypothetical protein
MCRMGLSTSGPKTSALGWDGQNRTALPDYFRRSRCSTMARASSTSKPRYDFWQILLQKYLASERATLIQEALWLIVTNEKYWLGDAVADYGFCMSPDDCYLGLRALSRIGVRMCHRHQSVLKRLLRCCVC